MLSRCDDDIIFATCEGLELYTVSCDALSMLVVYMYGADA
jgi:hypothetical protein